MLSNYLAELWGISLVVVALALLIKPKHLKNLFAEAENEAKLFCWGVATLVIGIAMVLSYNVWEQSWQVIVTILGWLVTIKGLALLFIPEMMKKWIKKAENASYMPFVLIVLLLIGLVLTYFGFTA